MKLADRDFNVGYVKDRRLTSPHVFRCKELGKLLYFSNGTAAAAFRMLGELPDHFVYFCQATAEYSLELAPEPDVSIPLLLREAVINEPSLFLLWLKVYNINKPIFVFAEPDV